MIKHITTIVIGVILLISLGLQFYQFYHFMNQGARFTSQDGQRLCERVKILEHYSYGFQASKVPPTECNYYEEKAK